MGESRSLEELIQEGRPAPAVPARIAGHEVLVEQSAFGTSVYQIRGERVLTLRANAGYREDVVAALLDAVVELADSDDLGGVVHLRSIDVPGFALDTAALLGPGESDFFRNKPHLFGRGLQVVPVHRSEAADGEDCESFRWAVIGKGLGIDQRDWTRLPVPRADVLRLDSGMGGPLRRSRNSRRSSKPSVMAARTVLQMYVPTLPTGVRLSLRDMRGRQLELHREWDRVRGTLRDAPGQERPAAVDVPRHSAWQVLGPLFRGEEVDSTVISAEVPEAMLEVRVSADGRRYDEQPQPQTLAECLEWLRALPQKAGDFLVCVGRSGGVVQVMWHEGARLWLETPEPELRRSRGRHVGLDEAERMITLLACEDRVAVDELGDLEIV